jgi:hypothetical protein
VPTLTRRTWLTAIGIYALARLVSLDLLIVAAHHLLGTPMRAGPSFRLWHDALVRWDAIHYASIVSDGYPLALPLSRDGAVLANPWAFFPAFPLTAGALVHALGLPFEIAAITINVIAGAITAVLLARLVSAFADDNTALRAVAIWAALPTAFVLQVPYAESIYLLFAAGFLVALISGRDGLAALLLAGAGLSRGVLVPLAAAAGVRVLAQVVRQRRVTPPIAALAASAAVSPFVWILIAGVATGRMDAYAATQRAWGFSSDWGAMARDWMTLASREGASLLIHPTIVTLLLTLVLTTIVCARREIPLSIKVYGVTAAALLMALAQPGAVGFGSMPRFAFGLLTLPIALAIVVRRGWLLAPFLVLSTWLQYQWIVDVWSGRLGIAP